MTIWTRNQFVFCAAVKLLACIFCFFVFFKIFFYKLQTPYFLVWALKFAHHWNMSAKSVEILFIDLAVQLCLPPKCFTPQWGPSILILNSDAGHHCQCLINKAPGVQQTPARSEYHIKTLETRSFPLLSMLAQDNDLSLLHKYSAGNHNPWPKSNDLQTSSS